MEEVVVWTSEGKIFISIVALNRKFFFAAQPRQPGKNFILSRLPFEISFLIFPFSAAVVPHYVLKRLSSSQPSQQSDPIGRRRSPSRDPGYSLPELVCLRPLLLSY